MEIIVSCALCTLCKAIVLVRSLDWRLLYRRQFLRSKDVAQEDDDAGLVEGAPPVHIFSIIKRDSLFVSNFVLVFLFLHFEGWIISLMKVK